MPVRASAERRWWGSNGEDRPSPGTKQEAHRGTRRGGGKEEDERERDKKKERKINRDNSLLKAYSYD